MSNRSVPIALYDGQILPASQVAIPFWDLGFAQGVSAVEQIRTYAGRLPLLQWHLRRLERGLCWLRLQSEVDVDSVRKGLELVVEHNFGLLPAHSDLGVCVVVTPGCVESFLPPSIDLQSASRPKVLVHSFPLAIESWKNEFRCGVRLATSSIREVPSASIPKEFKHRSRLNYYLAQQEIAQNHPGCRPLLESIDGTIADAATAGILIYRPEEGWLAPPTEDVLSSVSVAVVAEMANAAGIRFSRRAISKRDLSTAQEAMWCSTPTGLLPVIEVDGRPIGEGVPGPRYQALAELWTAKVGLDFRRQVLEG